jgi:hypothetical protein
MTLQNGWNRWSNGGAVWNGGTFEADSCKFFNNVVLGADGGAVFNDGTENHETELSGGGVFMANDCNFSSNLNNPGSGGAVYNNAGSFTARGCGFFDNMAWLGEGGAVHSDAAYGYPDSGVSTFLDGWAFSRNKADHDDGNDVCGKSVFVPCTGPRVTSGSCRAPYNVPAPTPPCPAGKYSCDWSSGAPACKLDPAGWATSVQCSTVCHARTAA